MSNLKKFNASENRNWDSNAAYEQGTLTWDQDNGLRIHDGETSGGNAVGGFSGNYYDLYNRPNGTSAVHDLIGGGASSDNGKFLMQTGTTASAWTTLPTTYDTLTIDTKVIGGIDNAAGTQITGINATLGSGAPYKYVFLSANAEFYDLFNRGSSIIGWKIYSVGDPGSFVTITEYLNNDLGGPSLGFSGGLPAAPWVAESSDYNAGTPGPLTLAADTAEWVLGTNGILTLPATGELADTGVVGGGTIITVPLNAAGDTVDYVGGASVIEVPTNSDTNLVQAGWVITFPDSTRRTVSSTGQAGGYTSIYYSESNPGLGGGTYPLTIESPDYVEHVAGAVSVTKGDATWSFKEDSYLTLPAGGSISDYDAGQGDTSIGSSLTGTGYSQIYWDGAPGTGNPFNGSDLFSWMYVDEQGVTLGYANNSESKDFEWKFNTDGNLTLPSGKSVVFRPADTGMDQPVAFIQSGEGFHINSSEGVNIEAVEVVNVGYNSVDNVTNVNSQGNSTFSIYKNDSPTITDVQVGWIANGPGVTDAAVTAVFNGDTNYHITIEGSTFTYNQQYTFTSNVPTLQLNTQSWVFDINGVLTLPVNGDIVNTNGDSVLFSGDYNDLSNKPTIPTDVKDLADSTSLLPAAQVRYEMKAASFTAVAGKTYWIDSTSGALTVTLPASPTTGDWVVLYDAELKWQTNNLTVSGNGNNIRVITMGGSPSWGSSASTATLNQPGWGPTGPLPNRFVWNGTVWSGAM